MFQTPFPVLPGPGDDGGVRSTCQPNGKGNGEGKRNRKTTEIKNKMKLRMRDRDKYRPGTWSSGGTAAVVILSGTE
jgi:hypothetical protein